jgi:hypothetical protein
MTKNIGPTSLVSYVSFTLIFFIIKNNFSFPGTSWIWAFLVITGFIQFVNNLYITNLPEVCGAYTVNSALVATIVPWITIFGVTCFCLIFIPGWLRVFSNTFGSAIANMAGMNETLSKIFKPRAPTDTSDLNPALQESVAVLYTNIGKFINEIDINDYHEEGETIKWDSLQSVMTFLRIKSAEIAELPALQKKLHKMLKLKEDAGYFMWFILIGSISVLISTNSVLLSSCSGLEFSL